MHMNKKNNNFFFFIYQDSLCLSIQRPLSSLEHDQIKQYNAENKEELSNDSLLAKHLAVSYLQAFSGILDWSCISPDSDLYNIIIKHNRKLEAAHIFLSKYLKSRRFLYKEEKALNFSRNGGVFSYYSPSCKQYYLGGYTDTPIAKKCKGVARRLQKTVKKTDFINATIKKEKKTRKIVQYSLKKLRGNIFCYSITKSVLSSFSSKRLFSSSMYTTTGGHSFPLHLKNFID